MNIDINEIKEKLKKYNQEHLLLKYDNLNDSEKKYLIDQINNIDFELMKELYKKAKSDVVFEDIDIEPTEYVDKDKMTENEKVGYIKKGISIIEDKELAVITMAGGQGTRLGHEGPKGTYKLLKDGKSLFELLCEHLKDAVKKYNTFINWYIMTSEQNYKETLEFFEENNYFDYPKNYIKFFIQGKLPMISEEGNILLEENGLIKEASDGHGGTLNTLKRTGILDEMKEKGFKWVFISGVDNVLANSVDPLLIGMAASNNMEIAVKSVEKTDPKEKAGVFCKKNKRIGVIEYTEITDEMANMRDDYGSLVYGDLNALLHLFSVDTLEEICEKRLPYHTAHKKADYLNKNGEVIRAEKPNAYKFESFIFDAFEMVKDVLVLRVKREDEFAPLKNATGSDSPETARKLYNDYIIKKTAEENYEKWLNESSFDKETKEELKSISGNKLEIRDRFYKELEFGTAGLRGIMGAGTNRMNKYVIRKATQGLANYIIKKGLEHKGVTILYDTRNNSKEFAIETALCLNANGIKTYLFDKERPVPILSYAVQLLKTTAGIMITASHNPPEYNGYKVYWSHGGQIVTPVDKEIIREVRSIKKFSDVNMMTLEEAKKQKLFQIVGNAVEERFLQAIERNSINNSELKDIKENVKIVYTPIHGTGSLPVQRILKRMGYKNLYVVPEQELPNGNFPTVEFPNPEDPRALKMAVELAKEVDADVCFGTDPDCDRFGMMVKDKNNNFVPLTGNQMASLMLEYVLSNLKEKNKIPENPAVVSTIVSTYLTKVIAKEYNVNYFETLTGFKYMGDYIKNWSNDNSYNFIFGFEESYGFLYGTHARDKDGVVASALAMEMVAYYKDKGITLLEQLENLYKKYGYFAENTKVITLKGEAGERQIASIMENIRTHIPKQIGEYKIVEVRDYKLEKIINMDTKEETKTDLPNSNVVYLELENDTFVAMRPSGTEPKLKFYIGVKEKSKELAENKLKVFEDFIDTLNEDKESQNKIKFVNKK